MQLATNVIHNECVDEYIANCQQDHGQNFNSRGQPGPVLIKLCTFPTKY